MFLNGESPIIQNMFGLGATQTPNPSYQQPNSYPSGYPVYNSQYGYVQHNAYPQQQNFNYNSTYNNAVAQYQQQGYNQPQYNYGYNQQPYYQTYNQQMNPMYGYGYNQYPQYQQPMYNNQMYGYQNPQYNRQAFTFNGCFNSPNNMIAGQPYYNPYLANNLVPAVDKTVRVQGYNPYGNANEYMFSTEDDARMEDIVRRRNEEIRAYQSQMAYNGFGYNYYGGMNYGSIAAIEAKYEKEAQAIFEEARQRRIDFCKKLSRIAHSCTGDDISEERLSEIYDTKEIVIPKEEIQVQKDVARMESFNIDNCALVRAQTIAHDAQVSAEYRSRIPGWNNMGLIEFLDNAGQIYAEDLLLESQRKHRLEEVNSYDSNRWNLFIPETHAGAKQLFPNLSESAEVLADGSLKVSLPTWMRKTSTESESDYAKDRQRFVESIYNPDTGRSII